MHRSIRLAFLLFFAPALPLLAQALAPIIAKSFTPNTIPANTPTILQLTVTNPNPGGLTGITFTDTLPAGLLIANPVGLTDSCAGVAVATANSVSLSGGALAANASCVVSVNVLATTPATFVNT